MTPSYPHPLEEQKEYQRLEWKAETDSLNRPDLKSLLHRRQDAAGIQIERLNRGEKFEKEEDFLYVVCRVKGIFYRPVEKNESLLLVTYPRAFSLIQSERYCYLLDKEDKPVFALSTLWVYRDPKTRKRKSVRKAKDQVRKNAPEIANRIPLPGFERLKGLDRSEDEFSPALDYKVGEKDIDSNGHRNNTVYLGLAEEVTDIPFSSFEINFEKECRLGEKLSLSLLKKEEVQEVKGRKEDGTLSFKAKFYR